MVQPLIAIAQIIRPHGIRGELKVQSLSDFPDRLTRIKTIFVSEQDGDSAQSYEIELVRRQSPYFLVKLKSVNDLDNAENFRNKFIKIEQKDVHPLEKNQFYHYQLVGLNVLSTTGEELGTISAVIPNPGNDLFQVNGQNRSKFLIPAVTEFIKEIDLLNQRMIINFIPGLI